MKAQYVNMLLCGLLLGTSSMAVAQSDTPASDDAQQDAAQEEKAEAEAAAPSEPPGEEGLSAAQEEAVEAELLNKMETLADDDPRRIDQLWELSRKLTNRHAYCRSVEYLQEIQRRSAESMAENKNAAAQAYYMCARARLYQGNIADAKSLLEASIGMAGERPEHNDLLFKMAIVRAKQAITDNDIDAIRGGLEEAKRLGVATGPGGGSRLAEWAVPMINETAKEIAVWSRTLLTEGHRELADEASQLAIEMNPNDRIADQVRRDLVMTGFALPAIGTVLAILVAGGLLYWFIRSRRLKRVVGDSWMDDDDLADLDDDSGADNLDDDDELAG